MPHLSTEYSAKVNVLKRCVELCLYVVVLLTRKKWTENVIVCVTYRVPLLGAPGNMQDALPVQGLLPQHGPARSVDPVERHPDTGRERVPCNLRC